MDELVDLTRDVEAALVPAGTPVILRAGERAKITQALGGSFSVVVGGNMYRIAAEDADALGREPPEQDRPAGALTSRDQVEAAAWQQLRTTYDPEIPVNIVELGLIYSCAVEPMEAGGGWSVKVRMTLTAPGCGMGEYLVRDIEQKLHAVAGVREATVELVWEPPWSQEMMSEAARLELGMAGAALGRRESEPVKKATGGLRNFLRR